MKSLLLVDDNTEYLEYLEERFLEQGWKVLKASNGSEALKTLEIYSVDFIVTDIRMPVMDGVDFIKKFRKLDLHIPILVMSGGCTSSEKDLLLYGANAFISKPFSGIKPILDFWESLSFAQESQSRKDA